MSESELSSALSKLVLIKDKPVLTFAGLRSRKSTIAYELAKGLEGKREKLPMAIEKERSSILNLNNCCEYCGTSIKKSTGGDHFYPMVKDGLPTEYCNDKCNIIPSCSKCNTSKSGKHWKEWLNSDSASNPVLSMSEDDRAKLFDKLERYDEFMQKYCKRKRYNKECFQYCIDLYMEYVDKVTSYMQENSELEFYTLNDTV